MQYSATKPLVSIIIACYNSESWVSEAIESCLQQTYQPIEVIVVNDGSTDNSLQVIQKYAEGVIILSGPNKKLSAARNKGFAVSKGDYCLFLDADDYLSPDTVEALVEAATAKENCVGVCHWCRFIDTPQGREIIEVGEDYEVEGDLFYNRFTKWFMPPHSILWPRHVFDRLGGWDEKLLNYHDYDLMARALLDGVGISRVHRGCAFYRKHSNTFSSSTQISRDHILSRIYFVEKLQTLLQERELLERYAPIVAGFYANIASVSLSLHDDLSELCIQRAIGLDGTSTISQGSWLHRIGVHLLGWKRKQRLAIYLSRLGIGSRARLELTRIQSSYREASE